MAKRRVLIFSLGYFPFVGGAEIAVKEITDRLADYEFEMLTVNLDGGQEAVEQLGRVRVYRLGRGPRSKYLFPWSAFSAAVRLRRLRPFDLLWAVMANQAGMAAALFKRRFPRLPFLLTLQEGDALDSLGYRLRLLGPRLCRVFRRADQVTAISGYLAEWAGRMGARCPVFVVPNGVDSGRFRGLGVGDQLRPEKIIITTSRLVYKNGVDILIEAMRFLPADVKLRIVGDGPQRSKLKAQSAKWGLAERVEFVGAVPPEKIPEYLVQADVFARPSRSEGLGNSFLEAMAAALPVVGTPVGGIPDFLQEGRTGWFCRIDDPRHLAERLQFILDPANRRRVEQVIGSARLLVEQRYAWPAIAAQMDLIFNRLLLY